MPSGNAVGYGEWGPIDGWRRPKPEYWHIKKIYSPVKIVQRKAVLPDDGGKIVKVAVENRHLFTDLSELEIKWNIGEMSGDVPVNLPPGRSGILDIALPDMVNDGDTLDLRFFSPQDYLIDRYRLILVGGTGEEEGIKEKEKSLPEPEVIIYENRVSIAMGDETWSINAVNGKLDEVKKDNKTIIEDGPELMLLPLRTGPCNTEHSLDIEPLNDVCRNWKGRITGTGEEGDAFYVEVQGEYDEAEMKLTYWFGRSPEVEIEYELIVKKDIDPRQIGLVFSLPRQFDNFSWERMGQWSYYPDYHIGRTRGSAKPFSPGMLMSQKYGTEPSGSWEQDFHFMGINDFRATRDNLIWGKLADDENEGVTFISDGHGAMRPYVGRDMIKVLAAGFSTAGGDLFFSSHLKEERYPLSEGSVFRSKLKLLVN